MNNHPIRGPIHILTEKVDEKRNKHPSKKHQAIHDKPDKKVVICLNTRNTAILPIFKSIDIVSHVDGPEVAVPCSNGVGSYNFV